MTAVLATSNDGGRAQDGRHHRLAVHRHDPATVVFFIVANQIGGWSGLQAKLTAESPSFYNR